MKSAVVKICNRNEIIFDTVFPRTFFFWETKRYYIHIAISV